MSSRQIDRWPHENRCDIPRRLWLGLPLMALSLPFIMPPLVGYRHPLLKRVMKHELGLVEVETELFLLLAIAFCALSFRYRRVMVTPMPVVIVWGGLAAFYFLGEETSWGQHYLGFDTPASVEALNTQQEFNLHNLGGWKKTVFSSWPRTATTVACLVLGLILPLALKERLENDDAHRSFGYWLIPNYRLAPAAFLAVFANVPDKMWSDVPQNVETYWNLARQGAAGEFKEMCIAMFMMFYFLSLLYRGRALAVFSGRL